MRLQRLPVRGGELRGADICVGRRSLVFAAADGAREAVVEGRGKRLGDVVGHPVLAQQDTSAFRIERDLVIVDVVLVGPPDECPAAVEDIPQIRDANDPFDVGVVRRRRAREAQRLVLAGTRDDDARSVVVACRDGGVRRGRVAHLERELAHRERRRHVDRRGQMIDVRLGPRRAEQPHVRAGRIEPVPAAARVAGIRHQRHRREPERLQAPQEDADVRNVVAATGRFRAAHVRRVRHTVERAVDGQHHALGPHRGGGERLRPQVIHELRGDELLEELHRARWKVGDVVRELLEHQRRALAPAIGDRVRHFRARRGDACRDAMQRPVADQIADVRRHPVGARLDELIVIELIEVFFDGAQLARDELHERVQRLARGVVAQAVDRREQPIQSGGVERHGISSKRSSAPGSRVSSSSGAGSPPTTVIRLASRRVCRDECVCESGCVPP